MNELDTFKVPEVDAIREEPEENEEKEDTTILKFLVMNPLKVGGHVKYTIQGADDEGVFTEARRFKEFHALAQVLKQRWPGCYVPSIPEKNAKAKLLNKEGMEFIEERRCLLQRFMN